ncbi:MAG: polyprenyl synthetase family protein [Candidatus Tectomicrobia bacterium]|nr:polyprenyl synthetase family protein [Candidatus Tectomicrobia bacterium]
MQFNDVLELVRDDLERVSEAIRANFESDVALIPTIGNYLSNNGGKRLRPIMVLLSSRFAGYAGARAITYSCVVEFIHLASLLHDDVVDEAELRRGGPSANSNWGNEASVLVGDFLFAKSFALLAKENVPEVLTSLSQASCHMAEGEVLELVNHGNLQIAEEEYLDVVYRKTAALFESCCEIGAYLGQLDAGAAAALRAYGRNIGLAFQLVDDALDYVAHEDRLGKSIGKDLEEANVTLPLILLHAQASPQERAFLNGLMEAERVDKRDLATVIEYMERYHIIEEVLGRARAYADAACEALKPYNANGDSEPLMAVANYVIERQE